MSRMYKRWSPSELEFIKENSDTMTDNVIAIKLSNMTGEIITPRMINNQRRKMNIKRGRGRPKRSDKVRNAIDIVETGIKGDRNQL